jgi:NAD(P)-dependent dehydrogenase (short-subunit alcohol dehydrogenase family)
MDLNGKTIVLTGAASGIGRALLNALCGFDMRIVAADLDEPALRAAIAALPRQERVIPFASNLDNPETVDALFDAAEEAFGPIDAFIANAGYAYYESFDGRWDHIEAIYATNVFSPLYALGQMRDRNPNRPFTVVITASSMSFLGLPGYALYAGTKAALDRFAESFRLEAPPHQRLMLVYPIATRTRFFKHKAGDAPTPWPSQTPEAVAVAIVRGLQRDQTTVQTSRLFAMTLAVHRVVPVLRLYQVAAARSFRNWLRRHPGGSGS